MTHPCANEHAGMLSVLHSCIMLFGSTAMSAAMVQLKPWAATAGYLRQRLMCWSPSGPRNTNLPGPVSGDLQHELVEPAFLPCPALLQLSWLLVIPA